jgi:putative membrane protein
MTKLRATSLLFGAAVLVPLWFRFRNKSAHHEISSSDAIFLREAASDGRLEVELGGMAAERSASEAVKNFARRMQRDHRHNGEKLKQVSLRKGVQLPETLMTRQQAEFDRLSSFSGKEFDREYMKAMIEDHREDVSKFENHAKHAEDPDVKRFAKNTAGILKEHLTLAQKIAQEIGASS